MNHRQSSSKFLRCIFGSVFALSVGYAHAQIIQPQQSLMVLPPVMLDLPNSASNSTVKQHLANKIRSNGHVRLIVKLRASAEPEHLLGLSQIQSQRNVIATAQNNFTRRLAQYGSVTHKQLNTLPFVVIQANDQALAHILNSSDVVSVQEDVIVQTSLAQSVPLIGGNAAWTAGASGAGQTVAILDTGVDSSHPFLSGKVVAEACFSTTDQSAKSVCPNGANSQIGTGAGKNCALSACTHGTHVAGIAAGKSSSFSGVAKDANIIAVQIFTSFPDANGAYNSLGAYSSDIMSGLEHVYSLRNTYKISSVNMSLGGGDFTSNCDSDSLKPIIDNLRAAGIATIIASGNAGKTSSISFPACISTSISVGATTKSDVVDSYSNSASFLSLLAPGSDIKSSVPGGIYENYSGTSMATPHVAGAWAVLKSKMPNATVTEVLNALIASGKKITDSRNSIVKPRIQVDAALAKLSGTPIGTCYKASNPSHVAAGRAYAKYGYAYAKGSNQRMGMNYSFFTSKLRNTATNYYVVDSTCP